MINKAICLSALKVNLILWFGQVPGTFFFNQNKFMIIIIRD
jgi:hypothetical protein